MKKIIFIFSLLFLSNASVAAELCGPYDITKPDGRIDYFYAVNTAQPSLFEATRESCANRNGVFLRGQNRGGAYYDYYCYKKQEPCASSSSSASNTSSPSNSCPSGQFKDALGNCNTKCDASAGVYNPTADACQQPTDCVYPEKRNPISNSCSANEDKCAINANINILTGYTCQQCAGCPAPSCPAGWTITETNQCVQNQTSSAPSSSGSGSSSSARPTPPTNSNDNTDQSQSTSNSQSIPTGISNNDCLNSHSTSACTAIQNCQLTFGVNNCLGVTGNQNCPNSYVINGQKICVLNTSGSASSSGSGTSSGSNGNSSEAGDCDPTSKNYLRCLTVREIQIPEEGGSFDENKAAQALQDANEELQNKIESIKAEMHQVLNVGIQGAGTITDNCINIFGVQVCFGFAKFIDQLSVIPWAIMLLAYVAALFVILRR